ncbi:exonuclease domain-containing protein [Chitiniphilus eburneus]|uniref:exonuclease domain-containing protein n=1 Tax=Chitiniphilus eburneus TaxID=2571148 RepID=UPI0035D0D58C
MLPLHAGRRLTGMTPHYPEPMVLVDLETTGANPLRDRITEIGIVEVGEGGTQRWSTLVNPGVPIPHFIQRLTGIDDAMVADAPSFAALADDVAQRLRGRVFVAHNARFDYGFLKNEFKRLGLPFRATVLCTVKLSRKLYPQHFKHNLDSLVERHSLYVEGERHRALTDAELLWQFLSAAARDHAPEVIHAAIAELTRQPALPPGLDASVLDDLPELPGVYVFHDAADVPLYLGKHGNLRKGVLAHFVAEPRARDKPWIAEVRRLAWHETPGELGAQLLETRLLKQLTPLHNPRPRPARELCAWQLVPRDGLLVPERVDVARLDFAHTGRDQVYGPFCNRRDANKLLEKLADNFRLCRRALGLETAGKSERGGCLGCVTGRCKGLCLGKESAAQHNARLQTALAKSAFVPWPYPGPVGLPEGPEWASRLHVIDRWVYLGTIADPAELPALLQAPTPMFDIDLYKLLHQELRRRGEQSVLLLTAS